MCSSLNWVRKLMSKKRTKICWSWKFFYFNISRIFTFFNLNTNELYNFFFHIYFQEYFHCSEKVKLQMETSNSFSELFITSARFLLYRNTYCQSYLMTILFPNIILRNQYSLVKHPGKNSFLKRGFFFVFHSKSP